ERHDRQARPRRPAGPPPLLAAGRVPGDHDRPHRARGRDGRGRRVRVADGGPPGLSARPAPRRDPRGVLGARPRGRRRLDRLPPVQAGEPPRGRDLQVGRRLGRDPRRGGRLGPRGRSRRRARRAGCRLARRVARRGHDVLRALPRPLRRHPPRRGDRAGLRADLGEPPRLDLQRRRVAQHQRLGRARGSRGLGGARRPGQPGVGAAGLAGRHGGWGLLRRGPAALVRADRGRV
ncbi:MAG: Integral membrane protein, partial [uncultured Nocardioides sp.]